MRKIAIPELGNLRQASWASCIHALNVLNYPYTLKGVTARFKTGAPMLLLLQATSGTFIVGLNVCVEGKRNNHCVAFSADKGMLVDNGSTTRPVYIKKTDKRKKKAAKLAFKLLVGQKIPPGTSFSVNLTSVYELCRI